MNLFLGGKEKIGYTKYIFEHKFRIFIAELLNSLSEKIVYVYVNQIFNRVE